MTTLYLIRHGETDNNKEACFNGSHSDQPLNDRGRAQAVSLAAPFAKIAPDAIFASPLRRAVGTAECLRGALSIPIHTVAGLQEMNMGVYDGVSFEEVRTRDPKIMENWNCADVRMPGGECFSEVQRRVTAAIVGIVAENRGKALALVAHGTLLQLFLMGLLKMPFVEKKNLPILHNAAYYALGIEDDGSVRILCYNVCSHLPPTLMRPGFALKELERSLPSRVLQIPEFRK